MDAPIDIFVPETEKVKVSPSESSAVTVPIAVELSTTENEAEDVIFGAELVSSSTSVTDTTIPTDPVAEPSDATTVIE